MKTFSQIVYEDSGSHSNDKSKQKTGIFKLLGAIASGLFGGSGSSQDAKDAKDEREAIQKAKDDDREERRKFKQDLKNKKRSIKNKLKEMSIKTETAKRKVAHKELMASYQRQLDRLKGNINLIEKSKNKDAHFYEELFNKAVESTAAIGITKDDNSDLDDCQMYVGMMLYKEDGSLIQKGEGEKLEDVALKNFAERYGSINGGPNPYINDDGNWIEGGQELLEKKMREIPGLDKAFEAVKNSGSVDDAVEDFLQIEPTSKHVEDLIKTQERLHQMDEAIFEHETKINNIDKKVAVVEECSQNNICRNLDVDKDSFTEDGKYVEKDGKYYEVATGKEAKPEAVKDKEFKPISNIKEEDIDTSLITDGDGKISKERLDDFKRRGIIPKDCNPEGDEPYDIASLGIPDVDSVDALKAKVDKYNSDLQEKNEKKQNEIREKVNKSKSNAVIILNSKGAEWRSVVGGDISERGLEQARNDLENKRKEEDKVLENRTVEIMKDSGIVPANRKGLEDHRDEINRSLARAEDAKREAKQTYGPNAKEEMRKRENAKNGIYTDISLSEYATIHQANKINSDKIDADDIEEKVPEEYTYIDDNGKEQSVNKETDPDGWEAHKDQYYTKRLKQLEGEQQEYKDYKITTSKGEDEKIKIEIKDADGNPVPGDAEEILKKYNQYRTVKNRAEEAEAKAQKDLKSANTAEKRAIIKKQYGMELTDEEKEALGEKGKEEGEFEKGEESEAEHDEGEEEGEFEDDEAEHDEEDKDEDTNEYVDEEGKTHKNPSLIWHRRKLKNGHGTTKNYYDKDNNSISKKQFKQKLENYRKAKANHQNKNQRQLNNSLDPLYQKKGMVIEFKSTTTFKPKYKQSSSSFIITKLDKSR